MKRLWEGGRGARAERQKYHSYCIALLESTLKEHSKATGSVSRQRKRIFGLQTGRKGAQGTSRRRMITIFLRTHSVNYFSFFTEYSESVYCCRAWDRWHDAQERWTRWEIPHEERSWRSLGFSARQGKALVALNCDSRWNFWPQRWLLHGR